MKPRAIYDFVIVFPFLLVNLFAVTVSPVQADNKAAVFSHGILWKIEHKDLRPSYLLGTIHSDDKRVTVIPPLVKSIFERADSFTMELKIDNADMAIMAESMFFSGGKTLKKLLGDDLYNKTREAVIAHGLSAKELNKTKPWVIMTMLSMPRPDTGVFLDLKLHLQAIGLRKKVFGLETMKEQIAIFDEMTTADQIALLQETIATSNTANQKIEQMIKAYLNRDLDELVRLSEKMAPKDEAVHTKLMDRLLTQRNKRMIRRMMPHIETGNAFIAVGVLHLPGKQGLLEKLAVRGYKISPVY